MQLRGGRRMADGGGRRLEAVGCGLWAVDASGENEGFYD